MDLKYFKKLTLFLIILLFLPNLSKADSLGQQLNFFIEPEYDISNRNNILATLIEKTNQLYFYIASDWWHKRSEEEQVKIKSIFSSLSVSFEEEIYPRLTTTFGSEWKPGIDNDERITLLFHPMKEKAKGYYRTVDEYPKLQSPSSNEREMVYLNANSIFEDLLTSYLSHEFCHLIIFNQKEKKYGLTEETWLQELISEIAPTIVGYDKFSEKSNLKNRLEDFLKNPSDSLTEWQGTVYDYGIINIFGQYLIDHYGIELLVEALHSPKIGISSLDFALRNLGIEKDFIQVFQDWLVAVLINDCNFGKYYCYLNENLNNLKVLPSLNFLPVVGRASLRIEDTIKDWSGRWFKLIGGQGNLKLEFDGVDDAKFYLTFLACKDSKNCLLKKLDLDEKKRGKIELSDFSKEYKFLDLILSVQEKKDFDSSELSSYPFSIEVSTSKEEEEIQELLERISFLKAKIAELQKKISTILAKKKQSIFSCKKLEEDLYYGMRKNPQVRCLQEILKAQGPEIYPQGLVTGNFLEFTLSAVIRFQEKYAKDILIPLGLKKGTGFVGKLTRAKLNELLRR